MSRWFNKKPDVPAADEEEEPPSPSEKDQRPTILGQFMQAVTASGARPEEEQAAPAEEAIEEIEDDHDGDEEKQLVPVKKLDIEFPFIHSDASHAISMPFTFMLKEIRWSEVMQLLSGANEPLVLHISAQEIERVWGMAFALKRNTYHFAPKCVRTLRYTTHGVPLQLAYNLVTRIPETDEFACWTHASTVVSGVPWRVPDGNLSANQDGRECCAVTWHVDRKLMRDAVFHRMKIIPEDQLDVTNWLRRNQQRVEIPGPAVPPEDALVSFLQSHAHNLDPQPVHNKDEEDEEEEDDIEDEDDEGRNFQHHTRLSLSTPKVQRLMEKLRQKINAKKHLMSLNQGLSLQLIPVHPLGWDLWRSKQHEMENGGLINPVQKDPYCIISVTIEITAIPILAHPAIGQIETEPPASLGCVHRQASAWKNASDI